MDQEGKHDLVPRYLSDLLHEPTPSWNLRLRLPSETPAGDCLGTEPPAPTL